LNLSDKFFLEKLFKYLDAYVLKKILYPCFNLSTHMQFYKALKYRLENIQLNPYIIGLNK